MSPYQAEEEVLLLFAVKISRARAAATRFHAPVVTQRGMTIQEKIEPSKCYRRASRRITLARLFRAQLGRFHLRCRALHRVFHQPVMSMWTGFPVHYALIRTERGS